MVVHHRWDLDRSYLETDIHSWTGLVRAAFEPPSHKVAVPGATALVRGALRTPDSRLTVISGSPRQMAQAIRARFALDGVSIHRLALKDNLANLARRRWSALRDQAGHKLPTLLEALADGPDGDEFWFGDDAEVDAAVYAIAAAARRGEVSPEWVERTLTAAGAYPDEAARGRAAAERLDACERAIVAFILLDRATPDDAFAGLSPARPVLSWIEAADAMFRADHLSRDDLVEVIRQVRNRRGDAAAESSLRRAEEAVGRSLPPFDPERAAHVLTRGLLGRARTRRAR